MKKFYTKLIVKILTKCFTYLSNNASLYITVDNFKKEVAEHYSSTQLINTDYPIVKIDFSSECTTIERKPNY